MNEHHFISLLDAALLKATKLTEHQKRTKDNFSSYEELL